MVKQHGSKTISARISYELYKHIERMAGNKHMNLNDYTKMCLENVSHFNRLNKSTTMGVTKDDVND